LDINNILIASSDWTNPFDSLWEVFQRTTDAKFTIAVNRVEFALFSIDYVGLCLTKDDIKSEDVHANAITPFAISQDVFTVKGFSSSL